MKPKIVKLFMFIAGLGLLSLSMPSLAHSQTLPATITINAATTINSFTPVSIFGNNVAYWNGKTNVPNSQAKVQAAGNFFIRYPGGSSSDDFHWNGTGSFNSNGYWVPNNTTYTPGFGDNETYRGTTTSYGTASNLSDGSAATTWMSNVDTDFPNHQWVYLDLGGGNTVNAVTILWGKPAAATFVVQTCPDIGWPPPYQNCTETIWTNTSAATVTGTGDGTTQGVAFANVTAARYVRVLLTSSTGPVTANLGSVTITGPAYAIRELYVYHGTTQLSANINNPGSQSQATVSSTDPACTSTGSIGSWALDFGGYMTYINSFAPKAIPMITVNWGTGTPQEAAAWVHYANITKGYGIKYWQIGNETEGNWETGGPINTQDYVRRYIEFYDAMKAVDPTITITGPVAGGFNDSSNMYDCNGIVQDFISILAAKGKIDHLNAIDFHWYPNYPPYTNAQALASTSGLDTYPASLNGWLTSAGVPSPGTVPVIMSEFNVDPSDTNFQVQLVNGLWVGDALGHFIKNFGGRGYCNLWDTLNGGSGDTSTTGGDLGYLNVNNDGYQYQAHASYWAMQMMSSDWAISGDANKHQLISTAVSGPPASLFTAYSDYRPDGIFSLAVINKSPTNTYNTWVTGLPFPPNATANGWTFNNTNYVWETTTSPYHAAPDTAPTTVTFTGVSTSFPVTFKPYSLTVLQFTSAAPTSTPTSTPTKTLTPTPTLTVTQTPTFTITNTPTLTFTTTRTGTPTVTSSPTSTPTPTNSFTITPTPTITDTPTVTFTPSWTNTPTQTYTVTNTFTVTLTFTPTNTLTITDTPTATSTATPTSSLTPTATPTTSPTVTKTPTVTNTPTATNTPAAAGVPVLYPNPVVGHGPVSLEIALQSPADSVNIKVFTTAFRKVAEQTYSQVPAGVSTLSIDLKDKTGVPLANGLYYVVVRTPAGRTIAKLLILR